jgi:hypothetical protein
MVAQTQISVPTTEGSRDALLRHGLVADAVVSAAVGASMIAGSGLVSDFTGLTPSWLPAAVGASFLPWALHAFWLGRRRQMNLSRAKFVAVGNCIWVLASYAMLIFGVLDLTAAGAWTVGIVAELVGLFAVAQYLGLRRIRDS